MECSTDSIAGYYNRLADEEWQRLESDTYHRLEFEVTMHFLRRHLPSEGLILDAGGGPGRYSLALCRAGYHVALLDLAPNLLEKAAEVFAEEPEEVRRRLVTRAAGDVCDLSAFPAAHFDAALCLGGPISHLLDPDDRRRAMAELVRVTRPGGVVCVSVVGILAALRTLVWKFQGDPLLDEVTLERAMREGNANRWHFFRAGELRDQAEAAGLRTLEMAGLEGLSTGLPEATNQLRRDERKWSRWMDLLLATATEPVVVDLAEHLLYVGRVEKS